MEAQKKIHQTWKSKQDLYQGGYLYKNVKSWFESNPGLEHFFYSDSDCESFIKDYHPDILEIYQSLTKPVERADVFRYLVILSFGGIYADVDTYSLKSTSNWISKEDTCVLGVERGSLPVGDPYFNRFRSVNIAQFIFYAESGHPFLKLVKEMLIDRLSYWPRDRSSFYLGSRRQGVYETLEKTGPAFFTDAVEVWLQGEHLTLKDILNGYAGESVRIHPIEVFGSHYGYLDEGKHFHWPKGANIIHLGQGSWINKTTCTHWSDINVFQKAYLK